MSDGTAPQGNALDSAGAALHAERGRQGLSVGDVSRHLKLSVRQVEALERDDYQMFSGSVFVHGFLRNYAKLLGLDAALLIGAADRKLEAGAMPLAPQADRNAEVPLEESDGDGQKSLMPLFLAAAILVGGVATWMLIQQQDAGQDAVFSDDIVASQLAGEATNNVDSAYNEAAPLTEPGAEVALTARQDAAVRESDSPASQGVGRNLAQAPQIRLQLGFREESWVEVSDRYGEVIFAELVPSGVARAVSGTAPLSVVIGNAAGVDLVYNGKPVNLSLHTRVDVARLTLE
jgi:cytoskeleton protein RodZ